MIDSSLPQQTEFAVGIDILSKKLLPMIASLKENIPDLNECISSSDLLLETCQTFREANQKSVNDWKETQAFFPTANHITPIILSNQPLEQNDHHNRNETTPAQIPSPQPTLPIPTQHSSIIVSKSASHFSQQSMEPVKTQLPFSHHLNSTSKNPITTSSDKIPIIPSPQLESAIGVKKETRIVQIIPTKRYQSTSNPDKPPSLSKGLPPSRPTGLKKPSNIGRLNKPIDSIPSSSIKTTKSTVPLSNPLSAPTILPPTSHVTTFNPKQTFQSQLKPPKFSSRQ
ncbi:hypothetical protein BLNAU_1675 [Blattamonas nauphoetae]|uniref:Uncharacterized protein n=1 Tax=Blattamonas nauphoetae TaxID=2049346 RepID=A0ABQ9YHA3_9EUKA|nr:hypothetical protein BLNAU_1675 [Blattamonas nauphoetae]